MRPSGLVSGDLLDRPQVPPAAENETDGAVLHLDVPHLRYGLSFRSPVKAPTQKECLVPGKRLHVPDFPDGIRERNHLKKAELLPLGLQPCKTEHPRGHSSGLRPRMVSDRTFIRKVSNPRQPPENLMKM